MGRIYKYFPPPPPVCEELSWFDLPVMVFYHITKLESIEIDDLVVHCVSYTDDFDETGCKLIVFECSHEFLDKIRSQLPINCYVGNENVHFVKRTVLSYRVIQMPD